MTISDSQLETWCHQGAVTTAKATHERVRRAIEAGRYPADVAFDTFLQGSYRNDTNIRGDSDVDVVAELQTTFTPDTGQLPAMQAAAVASAYPKATYSLFDFHRDVEAALVDAFGRQNVTVDNKCIRVRSPGMLPCDVVVATEYHRYRYFYSPSQEDHALGIRFYALRDQRWIVNYPRIHYSNGVAKNSSGRTGGNYKPAVRMLKNARSRLNDAGRLESGVAPSYFVESLLYNVPDASFSSHLALTYLNVVTFIFEALEAESLSSFVCQNEQLPLFGPTPEQWTIPAAIQLVRGWWTLWQAGT